MTCPPSSTRFAPSAHSLIPNPSDLFFQQHQWLPVLILLNFATTSALLVSAPFHNICMKRSLARVFASSVGRPIPWHIHMRKLQLLNIHSMSIFFSFYASGASLMPGRVYSPISATTHAPIVPAGIISYMERRRISWECYCGLPSHAETGTPVFLELKHTRWGVVASCHICGCYSKLYSIFSYFVLF